VTRHPASGPAFGLAGPRRLFGVPWRGQLMVGTGHLPYEGGASGFQVDPAHVERFAAEVRAAAPGLRLHPADVAVVHAGLLPVTGRKDRDRVRLLRRHRVLDHESDGLTGALSVVTVKLTTAPTVAGKVLDRLGVASGGGGSGSGSRLPLPGGRFESLETLRADAMAELGHVLDGDVVEHLLRMYGARWRDVVEQRHDLTGWSDRVVPEAPVIRAQLVHAVLAERARTVDDLLLRRTELGPRGLVTPAARRLADEALFVARGVGVLRPEGSAGEP
jgi:glycerol-3-phosphate dehydrogenase